MKEFLIANMAPIMFASLIVFLLIGYPAAFSLAFIGIGFGLLGIQLGIFTPNLFHELPDRVMTVISNDSLLAIPFFTAMGLISLPIMLRYGYNRPVASGVIAASGTLAQIIPPSLVLIVLADQLGRSVGDLYKGAFIPGFTLTGLYVIYVILVSVIRPEWVPALPKEARTI